MAANDGSEKSSLDLLKNIGPEFSFFQAVRLLEATLASDNGIHGIQFSAGDNAAFQPNFIAGVSQRETNADGNPTKVTVAVNGFGLTGQQGPLPDVFASLLHEKGASAFLDLFNHRVVGMVYEIKKRFSPLLFNNTDSDVDADRLRRAIAGFDTLDFLSNLPAPSSLLMGFAPLLGNRRINYALIRNLGRAALELDIKVSSGTGAWRKLASPLRATLSGQRPLGTSGIGLGQRYWDNQADIRFEINALDIEQYRKLLPGGEKHAHLISVLSLVSDARFLLRVQLHLPWVQVPVSVLNSETNNQMQLGQSSWIKSKAGPPKENVSITMLLKPELHHQEKAAA